MEYQNFPFVKLCKIFQDEGLLSDYGISKKDWEKIKDGFNEAHPSEEERTLTEAYKLAIKASIELNKSIAVMNFIVESKGDWKEYFEIAKIKYTGDAQKDGEYLKKLIEKAQTKVEVFEGRLKKIQEELERANKISPSKPITTKQAYKALAGLEKAGANIPDFETFTCGKYDAWNEVIKDSNKK